MEEKKEKQYIKIQNKQNKIWFLPENNLKMGFCMYQPSSIKGKALKRFIPLCWRISGIKAVAQQLLHIQICDLDVPADVIEKSREVMRGEKMEISYFAGTPSVHQKGILQLSEGSHILGYAKFSGVKDVQELFLKEKKMLDWLHQCNIKNIPRCLCCEKTQSDRMVFVQDTKKTLQSKTVHGLEKAHVDFLRNLSEKTEIECKYVETDYYQTIQEFKRSLFLFEHMGMDENSVLNAIKIVEDSLSKQSHFSVYHGDFTPWNTFITGSGELYVFDFEYAQKTYPKYLDVFHFYTQTMRLEKRKSVDDIINGLGKIFETEEFKYMFDDLYVSYLGYLLSVMALYMKRDQGKLKQETCQMIRAWYELMEKAVNITRKKENGK